MDVSNDILDKGFIYILTTFLVLSDLLARDTYCIGTVRVHRKHFPKFGKQNINSLERGQSLSREILGVKFTVLSGKTKNQ